jgi:hypothetical protein
VGIDNLTPAIEGWWKIRSIVVVAKQYRYASKKENNDHSCSDWSRPTQTAAHPPSDSHPQDFLVYRVKCPEPSMRGSSNDPELFFWRIMDTAELAARMWLLHACTLCP